MLPIFSHPDIKELRLIHTATVLKRKALSERYECLRRELDEKKEQNEKSRRDMAVMKRRIKDIQKDIFLMNSTRSDLDETSVGILLEIGNKEHQLSALKNRADILTGNFDITASDIQQALMDVAALEADCRSISMEIASLEKIKHDLSGEIAKCLENTSLERKKVEVELNDLSEAFLRIIDERQTAEDLLAERRAACEKLSAAMDELLKKISALEAVRPILDQIKMIQREVANLEAEIESLDMTRRTLLKEMNDCQMQFEAVTSENMELTAVCTVLENDVGLYEKMMSEVKIAQASSDHTKSRMNQVTDELMEKLIAKTALDQAIQDIWHQFDSLADLLMESCPGL